MVNDVWKNIKNVGWNILKKRCNYGTYIKWRSFYTKITTTKHSLRGRNAYVIKDKRNKDYKYYVLRMEVPLMGPLAVARNLLMVYPWAEQKGYKLLVEYCYLDVLEKGYHNGLNIWEELFIQKEKINDLINNKVGIIFEEINAINKEICANGFLKQVNGSSNDFRVKLLTDDRRKNYYREWNAIAGKCLEFSPVVTQIENKLSYLFENGNKTVAVIFRAGFTKTYYEKASGRNKEMLSYHPRTPDVAQTMELLDKYLNEKQYDYIFLCCESPEVIETFKEKFKDKLIYIKRNVYMNYECCNMAIEEIKKIYTKEKMLSQYIPYLQEIYIASKCKFLFGHTCGGTQMALILNAGCYDDVYITADENFHSEY